ncbi:MAG: hypothetical protein U5O39_11750 [Gammaproteobacteria bacterium]|nr:hypothetical protein [Gammaproteobacteria bacterium]
MTSHRQPGRPVGGKLDVTLLMFMPAAASSFLILMAESVQGVFSMTDGSIVDDSSVLDILQ